MSVDDTWTNAEAERQDWVDDAIQAMLEDVAGGADVDWDIENIGDIRELVEEIIVDKLHLMSHYEFYPYRVIPTEPQPATEASFVISDQYGKITHLIEDSVYGLDATEFADLVGELFGGTCRHIDGYNYRFTPNSDYQGGLDDIKEDEDA